MQQLIDDLLAFSHTMESVKVFEKVNLNTLMFDVKHSLKHLLEEKNIKLDVDILPTLKIIPFQFHQLMQNLLNNSIKYSNKDVPTVIKVSAKLVEGKEIRDIGANPKLQYQEITVQDNGIGFDQQYAERIFNLFQRLHGKHEYGGTGIGLTICKKVVENHNGFIIAKGVPGVGATFLIYIPV
jgi:signal transduction histidine kinase